MFVCIKAYKSTSINIEVDEICFLLYENYDLYLFYNDELIPISEDDLDEHFRRV